MKNFMNDVVVYWLRNLWELIRDGSGDAWWNKFVILTVSTISIYIVHTAPDLAQDPSPFAENPFPLILLIFANVFSLWVLPNTYVRNKRFYEDMSSSLSFLACLKKMPEERDSKPKRY